MNPPCRRSACRDGPRSGRRAGRRLGAASAPGFTLVELLVAVALFALAGSLAYGALLGLTRARAQLEEESAGLRRLQFAIGLIERDLRAAAERPIRDAYGDQRPALVGERERLELSRHGWGNALAQPRAGIERVGYQLEGRRLQRLRYPVLDRTPGTAPQVDLLLEDVARLQWRYLGNAREPDSRWPPPRADAVLPRAVELTLVLADGGEIRRVLELPTGVRP